MSESDAASVGSSENLNSPLLPADYIGSRAQEARRERRMTAWDDQNAGGSQVLGWTVMGVLRDRQANYRKQVRKAEWETLKSQLAAAREQKTRIEKAVGSVVGRTRGVVKPVVTINMGLLATRPRAGPTVLALLFSPPDSDAMRMLDARGKYFDVRSGDTWDLFFPGYYHSRKGGVIGRMERKVGKRPVGRNFLRNWYFSWGDFNALREQIEFSSGRRWQYSGGSDLVLVNGWLPDYGDPVIDWASTISGPITDQSSGTVTLTLASLIERISRDFETGIEDAAYGVGEITDDLPSPNSRFMREFMINALGGIAAALGVRALGVK